MINQTNNPLGILPSNTKKIKFILVKNQPKMFMIKLLHTKTYAMINFIHKMIVKYLNN